MSNGASSILNIVQKFESINGGRDIKPTFILQNNQNNLMSLNALKNEDTKRIINTTAVTLLKDEKRLQELIKQNGGKEVRVGKNDKIIAICERDLYDGNTKMHDPNWKSATFKCINKEYYDKWYMEVDLWNVEKVRK